MECQNIIKNLKINKNKAIGEVVVVVEGESEEFKLLKHIFIDILDYSYVPLKRNKIMRDEFRSNTNPNSTIIVANTSSSNIKCFELNFPNGYTQADLQQIVAWVNQWTDYGAVIKTLDWAEIWDVYLYSNVQNTAAWLEYCFFWTKIYRSPTWPAGSQTSQFSQLWNGMLKITWNNGTYTVAWDRHNDVANFIECVATWYTEAFMPTQDYQPATKKYVDNKERHGTQQQYNQLGTYEQWKVYNILLN